MYVINGRPLADPAGVYLYSPGSGRDKIGALDPYI